MNLCNINNENLYVKKFSNTKKKFSKNKSLCHENDYENYEQTDTKAVLVEKFSFPPKPIFKRVLMLLNV